MKKFSDVILWTTFSKNQQLSARSESLRKLKKEKKNSTEKKYSTIISRTTKQDFSQPNHFMYALLNIFHPLLQKNILTKKYALGLGKSTNVLHTCCLDFIKKK